MGAACLTVAMLLSVGSVSRAFLSSLSDNKHHSVDNMLWQCALIEYLVSCNKMYNL